MGLLDIFRRRNGVEAQAPSTGDVGKETRRKGVGNKLNVLNFGHVFHHKAKDWFGPHTPQRVPLWVYKLMRKDPTIALVMRARRAILMSAEQVYEHPNEEIEDFGNQVLELHKRRLLSFGTRPIELGFEVTEMIWGLRDMIIKSVSEGGKVNERTLRNAFVVNKLKDHDPSFTTLSVDEVGDYLAAKIGVGSQEIQRVRSILWSHQMEYGNLHGCSGMLPSYNSWWYHNVLLENVNRYFESKGDPPYIGRAPDPEEWALLSEQGTSTDDIAMFDTVEFLNTIILNLRSGGSITLPSRMRTNEDGTATSNPLFDVEVMNVPDREDEFVKYAHYLDLLTVRGSLGNDLVVLIGSPGQAGAKQGGRMFHSAMKPDLDEWALTCNEYYMTPHIEANFPGAEQGSIRSGMIAENKAELVVEIVKNLKDVTQRIADGRSYKAAEILNIQKMLADAGLPVHDEDMVAVEGGGDMGNEPGTPGRPNDNPESDPQFDSDE